MNCILLAAGSGRRFTDSGGMYFKQLVPIGGIPLIQRIVENVIATGVAEQCFVVLGEDRECNIAIRSSLEAYSVSYVDNQKAATDNNLHSLYKAFKRVDRSKRDRCLVIECDCVFDAEDISKFAGGIKKNEIRWSHIGLSKLSQTGGFIQSYDPPSRGVIGVNDVIVTTKTMPPSVHYYRYKMFGITAFGPDAISKYIELYDSAYAKASHLYFHNLIQENFALFTHSSKGFSSNAFSFNTVEELKNG